MILNQKGAVNWTPWIIGILVIAIVIVAIPFFTNQNNINLPSPSPVTPQGGGPGDVTREDRGVTITDIVGNVDQFLGQTVTVEGEAETVFSPQVLRLDEEGPILGDEILVISRNPLPSEVTQGTNENVRVTGEVRRLTVTEVERELSLDLDPQIEAVFENRPVIIANQVTKISQ